MGLAGALLDDRVALAQGGENDYVDVALTLEYPPSTSTTRNVKVIVMNHGSKTAYDVEVVVDIVYPENSSHWALPSEVPVGKVSLEEEGGVHSFRWTIPAFGGLQRKEVDVRTIPTLIENSVTLYDKTFYPHEFFGEVTTSSFESDLHRGNNTDRIWYEPHGSSGSPHSRQAKGNYFVKSVTVDDLNPSQGDIVNFTITARSPNINIDWKVAFELTDGLAVDINDAATPPRKIKYSNDPAGKRDPEYSNGVFTIGTRKDSAGVTTETDVELDTMSATVPVRVASDAVVNEQCLTATVTGNPPPGVGPYDDDISDNVAKVCLGDQPPEPLVSDQIAAFTIYPCVGNTNSPCDATDDVRVRAVRDTDEMVLASGKALVHIPEEASRKYDSHANSVNAGTVVSWQIPVIWDASEFDAVNAQWSNLRDGFTASGISGEDPPGGVHIRAFEGTTSELVYKMNSGTTPPWTGEDTVGYNPGANNGPYDDDYIAEFEKLGTYKLQFTAKLTRTTLDGDENCDPNSADPPVNQRFCATETYVFHIGPMADLAVEDGGTSGHAASDQSALAIVAVNNGPDDSPGAQVTGLPMNADVIYPSENHGYDSDTGVWNIGELKVRGYYRSLGEPEPTLVLSAAADDPAAKVTISAKDYEVCIGGKDNPGDLAHTTKEACEADTATGVSWHSTPVYDYNSGNNSATITARAGVGPGIPGSPRTQTGTITVMWDAVATVNGLPVTHYEVQKLVNPWMTVATNVETTEYVDTNVGPGETHQYRVRAVNANDIPGPWSTAIEGSTAPVASGGGTQTVYQTVYERVYVRPDGPTGLEAAADGKTEVALGWDALNSLYDEPVDYYEVEASEDGKYWRTLAPSVTTTAYTHRGLEAGATHYYRVYAHSEEGRSLASAVACGSTGGALGKPCILSAKVDGSAVVLEWINATGADGHLAVLMNLVDYDFHGDILDIPAGTTSHTFEDVPPGRYVAIVLAYTGAVEGLDDYRYESALITVGGSMPAAARPELAEGQPSWLDRLTTSGR